MMEMPQPQSQQGGTEEPETNPSVPQQEEQPNATEGEVKGHQDLDVDYEGSEPKIEPISQEEKEENSVTEYANMLIPQKGTFHQRTMCCKVFQRIQWVHQEQGPEIMALWLQDMYIWLGFSPKAAKLLIKEQGLDSSERLRVLTDTNVDDIYDVTRKPGGKNANGTPSRGQQVSVIAQEILKLAAFLFHHRWRCTLDWEITEVHEDTVHLQAGQKKLKDEYKDPNMLPNINKSTTGIHYQEDHTSSDLW